MAPRLPSPLRVNGHCLPAHPKASPTAQLEAHEVRGNKGYVETAWLGSEADAEAATLPTASPKPAGSDAQQKLPAKGQARRVAFNSVGMGMKVQSAIALIKSAMQQSSHT